MRLEPRRMFSCLILWAVVGWASPAQAALPAVFQIEGGYVSGMEVGPEGTVRAFLGIPYAAPPIDDLRFRPPQPVQPWPALYEAIVYGPDCEQPDRSPESLYYRKSGERSEDCLYLNVWSAAESPSDQRPVMVWIHGGALTRGSGSSPVYDGTRLAEKGVVVVTINYRLGALGYFAHPSLSAESEHGASGNYGVLDQIAALRWVKRNIALFGGDPERVTIFGESAGSWSVHALMATPLADGLFHRAIGQSGAVFGPMTRLREGTDDAPSAEEAGRRLAAGLGVEGDGPEAAAALRELSAEEIIAARGFATRPVLDGWVFPRDIAAVFAAGEQAEVPVIVGSNEDEGTALLGSRHPETVEAFETMVRSRYGDSADEVMAIYPVKSDAEVQAAAYRFYADSSFACPMRRWARATEAAGSQAYLYFFTRVPPHPESERYGAYHAAEIAYVFDNLDALSFEAEATDRALAETMSNAWVSFAESGDPNHGGALAWPAYSSAADPHLELGDRVEVGSGLSRTSCDLFDRLWEARSGSAATSSGR